MKNAKLPQKVELAFSRRNVSSLTSSFSDRLYTRPTISGSLYYRIACNWPSKNTASHIQKFIHCIHTQTPIAPEPSESPDLRSFDQKHFFIIVLATIQYIHVHVHVRAWRTKTHWSASVHNSWLGWVGLFLKNFWADISGILRKPELRFGWETIE